MRNLVKICNKNLQVKYVQAYIREEVKRLENTKKEAAPKVSAQEQQMINILFTSTCKDTNQVNYIEKNLRRFIRKTNHVISKKINYIIKLENLEKKEFRTIVNRKMAQELNIIPKI